VVPDHASLRIRGVGLNFRDVLNVMGLYPGDPGMPGADCAGTVLELGDRVEHLRPAEDVFGEAPGCLSTYSLAPAALLTQKPPTWSFEEACAMPVIFVTVEESLNDLAKLKCGEHVLIHAAAGGVGLVAIQYAQFVGAEVYATAGAEEKHEYLRGLGVKYITSSRNGKQFEDDMKRFLEESGADGIDVVINSLSHDDYIPRSLALLRQGGRFMEIGKRGIWSHEEMREARPDVMYEKIAADTMMEREPWRYNGYLQRLRKRVDEGGLKPINLHTFNGFEDGVAAFQFLQRAQNIGKVVISESSRMLCRPDAMPLLSGGTGALGVVCAQFLVEEGAKSVCLLSRGGKPPAEVLSRWEWLQASTATLRVERCDVGQEDAVLKLREALPGPLSALLHLAGCLADGMLPNLTPEMLAKSYGPKVHGLYHLCNLPFEDGAAFLLFSSTSSLFGSPGQGNYSASNAVLDSLAPHWSAQGARRARSIQWGPWAEAGMAVQKGTVERARASGLGALSSAQGMCIMGSLLQGLECTAGAAHVKWPKFLRAIYDEPPRFLEGLAAEARRAAPGPEDEDAGALSAAALGAMAPEDRRALVQETIHSFAREVVNSETLAVDEPLLESGMDSLSGVEFRNRLLKGFGGVKIPNSAVFDYPTVGALADFIGSQIVDVAPVANGGAEVGSSAAEAVAAPAAPAQMLEQLNARATGTPLFLVPGAGLQAGGFQSLAALLPVPAYGVSWPKGALERAAWPASLEELAELLLREVRLVCPTGPYAFAGHSFGAAVCLEMARLAEAAGEQVALVALLDPRSLPPIAADLAGAFSSSGLRDTLALLSQTMADGSRYAAAFEELTAAEEADEAAVLRRLFSPAALATLEHVHETSGWYGALLTSAGEAWAAKDRPCVAARVVHLRAAEVWREAPAPGEGRAAAAAREFQARTFQEDTLVTERAAAWREGEVVASASVPGGHFAMLHEPHVMATALRLCHALVEAGAAEF